MSENNKHIQCLTQVDGKQKQIQKQNKDSAPAREK